MGRTPDGLPYIVTKGKALNAIGVLRDEFPGNVAWRRFVDLHRPQWQDRANKDFYLSAFGDEDFANVLTGTMEQLSLKWFEEKIATLDQRSALDVLQNEPAGRAIIRTLLMRMLD